MPPIESQFKPGVFGNPGGRPKDGIKALARKRSKEAFEIVCDLMVNDRSSKIKLSAAEVVLAYAWGKPTQGVELEENPGVLALNNLPEEAIRQMLALGS